MTTAVLPDPQPVSASSRRVAIVAGVVLLHVLALWGLQSGLLRRAIEVFVPVEIVTEVITLPEPKIEPPPRVKPPEPVQQPVVKQKPTPVQAAPQPVAAPNLPPAPNAPTGVVEPQPPPPPINAPQAVTAPPAPPAKVELPSTDADYLQNPSPAYPPTSKRLGEQGKVIVRALIGVDGTAKEAEIRQSSGFDRLDRAALETVRKWRYVPGKRGGVPETMWFNVPINFVLE